MMDELLERIKKSVTQNGITVKKLCSDLEITESGFYYSFKHGSIKVDTLKRIAEILGVSCAYLLGETDSSLKEINSNSNEIEELKSTLLFYKKNSIPMQDLVKLNSEIQNEILKDNIIVGIGYNSEENKIDSYYFHADLSKYKMEIAKAILIETSKNILFSKLTASQRSEIESSAEFKESQKLMTINSSKVSKLNPKDKKFEFVKVVSNDTKGKKSISKKK